jgi:chemotaxis methyl-accepting protein methylase
MAVAKDLALTVDWVQILAEQFSVEIDDFRTFAFNAAIARYAASLGENSQSLAERAQRLDLSTEEWGQVLHLATNHKTSFFRYMPVVNIITNLALSIAHPRILSVGCSTGEEVYSIAASLVKAKKNSFSVHGVDISPQCIRIARAGVYSPHPDIGDDVSYLNQGGKRQFVQWLRDSCTFEQHNIVGDQLIGFEAPDIIVTQNMLIYYRVETRFQILERLANLLPPGGHLITGPAEDARWKSEIVARVKNPNASVFQKV